MATNLQIDDELINRAVKLGHHRTKKAAVTHALTDYIHHLEQENILRQGLLIVRQTLAYRPA